MKTISLLFMLVAARAATATDYSCYFGRDDQGPIYRQAKVDVAGQTFTYFSETSARASDQARRPAFVSENFIKISNPNNGKYWDSLENYYPFKKVDRKIVPALRSETYVSASMMLGRTKGSFIEVGFYPDGTSSVFGTYRCHRVK